MSKWPGCSPLPSWLGTAPGGQVTRQVFKDLAHGCSRLPAKIQKVSSSLRLTSRVPECTASFTPSFTLLLHTHLSSPRGVSGTGGREMNNARGPVVKELTFWQGRKEKSKRIKEQAGTEEGAMDPTESGATSALGRGNRACKGLVVR